MSTREDNVRQSCGLGTGEGKCTRDGSQPSVGGATRTPASELTGKALAQLRRAGLVLPRGPQPGKPWTPTTAAEQHLLGEGRRLDRVRLLLLEQVGRLREQSGRPSRTEALAVAAARVDRLKDCPLSPALLSAVAAAAAGEAPEETARRLSLSHSAVTSSRQRAVSRLQARSVTHAVALCVAAGWVTPGQVMGGVTP